MARVIFWDVDTQYDFMKADGKLFVPDADHIIGNLKRLTDYAHAHGIRIVASADDHVGGVGDLRLENHLCPACSAAERWFSNRRYPTPPIGKPPFSRTTGRAG